MSTPTIRNIADELNQRARTHPIGMLQEIRGHHSGDIFRVNGNTTQKRWACHWGGRTELQFNIGIENGSWLPGNPASISVPVHGNTDLKKGLQADLMKQAGLTEDDL